jgi:ribosome biogenesis GTPase
VSSAPIPGPARVVATFGRRSLVATDSGDLLTAIRRGKRGDVVVGDRVELAPGEIDPAVIESIGERSSLPYRADAERTKEMAANIDQVALVFAPRPTYSETFIWRGLIAAHSAGIDAIAILNKADLLREFPDAESTASLLRSLGVDTLRISAKLEPHAARETLLNVLRGRATLLAGQSGMGKSTVLNLLVPHAAARTQEFSTKLDLGKQTTTASRWFDLALDDGGGAVIDSPGFQAFGVAHLDPANIAEAMPDFAPHLGQCRFRDCRHLSEPGCAILAALDRGDLLARRYAFYRELAQEFR